VPLWAQPVRAGAKTLPAVTSAGVAPPVVNLHPIEHRKQQSSGTARIGRNVRQCRARAVALRPERDDAALGVERRRTCRGRAASGGAGLARQARLPRAVAARGRPAPRSRPSVAAVGTAHAHRIERAIEPAHNEPDGPQGKDSHAADAAGSRPSGWGSGSNARLRHTGDGGVRRSPGRLGPAGSRGLRGRGAERPAMSAPRRAGASRAPAWPPRYGPVGAPVTPVRPRGHCGLTSASDHPEEPMPNRPTPRQLRLLRTLAVERGQTFAVPPRQGSGQPRDRPARGASSLDPVRGDARSPRCQPRPGV
jgi:hypothetical protein